MCNKIVFSRDYKEGTNIQSRAKVFSLRVRRNKLKARFRWVFTVSMESCSYAAISALLFPSRLISMVSLQRGGSWSMAWNSSI